jgi:hypothetical protein
MNALGTTLFNSCLDLFMVYLTIKNFSHNSWAPVQDSNLGPPEYECQLLNHNIFHYVKKVNIHITSSLDSTEKYHT